MDIPGESNQESNRSRDLHIDELIGPTAANAKFAKLAEKAKAVALAEKARDVFGVESIGDAPLTVRSASKEAVFEIAQLVADLWPKDFGLPPSIRDPASDNSHAVLYWGRQMPNGIAAAVNRASLYADRILIPNPYLDPFIYHPERSPLVQPEKWVQSYASKALKLTLLQPWIDEGVVELVPNPMCVDWRLQNEFLRDSKSRVDSMQEQMDDETQLAYMAEFFVNFDDEDLTNILDNLFKDIPGEHKLIIRREVDNLRALEPSFAHIAEIKQSGILSFGTGLTLEGAAFLSGITTAAIITDSELNARQLRTACVKGNAKLQPLASAMAELDFSFLNNVPLSFALELRKDGRMESFRRFMGDLAVLSGASGSHGVPSQEAQRVMIERIEHEYEEYKTEWKSIQASLARSAFVGAPLFGAASTVLVGNFALIPALGPTMLSQIAALVGKRNARLKLERQPLSIFFDLDSRK